MLKLAATYAAKRSDGDRSAWHALTRGLRRQVVGQSSCGQRPTSGLQVALLSTNAPFFYVRLRHAPNGRAALALVRSMPPAVAAAFTTWRQALRALTFHGTQCG